MKQVKIVAILLILFDIVWNSIALAAPTAKVTAKIVDETGLPMRNVDVRVSFQILRKSGELGLKEVRIEGKSNKEGNFSASNEDGVPQATVSAHKEGYYRSSKIVKFTSESRFLIHWKPWNPTIEIILKKKRNPKEERDALNILTS